MNRIALMIFSLMFCGVSICAAQPSSGDGAVSSGDTAPVSQNSDRDTKDSEKGDSDDEVKKDPDKLKTGIIASTGSYGSGKVNVESLETGLNTEKTNPVIAGVSYVGRNKCRLTAENISKKSSYSVSIAVEGLNKAGKKAFSKYVSFSLKPGQKDTEEFTCKENLDLQVVLKKGVKK